MQRKNNILKRAKSGMAMIMAIAVIVIIATIMALSMRLTSQTTKRTTDVYLYEQAALLAHSATEYALLKISKENNSTNPCNVSSLNFTPDLDNNTSTPDFYHIDISILYSYKNPPASCVDNNRTFATVTTDDQNGSVLLDVTVSVNDTTVASEPIRYFRRTLQKL